LAPVNPRTLLWRIVSALVLAPPALAAVWFGPPWVALLVLLGAGGMAWEWGRLCSRGKFRTVGWLTLVTGVSSILVLFLDVHPATLSVLLAVVGASAVAVAAATTREAEPLWAGLGTLWLTLGAAGFLWLALGPPGLAQEQQGRNTALWLLAVVWATDIGAYVVGRALGGPRLAPRISPRKTWAGLIGGTASAAVAAVVVARLLTGTASGLLIATSVGLAVVAQLGDLAESLAKRHFGVKDSSGLIPGHGGLLDRLDGLIAAAIAAAAITIVAGEGPLAWGQG
jgi:phosphatidate cytidylyltransferase